jgi:hypothetical protein
MKARLASLAVVAVLAAACETERPLPFVIPGPTGPSAVPTAAPYVWDTREELAVWVDNGVSKGAVTVEGAGADAFIRVEFSTADWVLRGPDLSPAPTDVRSATIRYRWRVDPSLPASASQSHRVSAHFESRSAVEPFHSGQITVSATLTSREALADATFNASQLGPPIDVQFFYLTGFAFSRGVLEIDRIALVR